MAPNSKTAFVAILSWSTAHFLTADSFTIESQFWKAETIHRFNIFIVSSKASFWTCYCLFFFII